MIYFGATKIEDKIYFGGTLVSEIYLGDTLIWPEDTGLPIGTTYNFDYTGTVQSVELPKGTYKLQCWGAQGGRSYKSSSYTGSKGGYSEGVLKLDSAQTLYVFVGGQGSYGSSTSLVNGGWNGGGASVGYTSYSDGYSYPASGGGATDIALTTSTMSYSSGRTNRSSASLLSRIIVAGGGAGASYAYETTESTSTSYETIATTTLTYSSTASDGRLWFGKAHSISAASDGDTIRCVVSPTPYTINIRARDTSGNIVASSDYTNSITLPDDFDYVNIDVSYLSSSGVTSSDTISCSIQRKTTTTTSSSDSDYSSKSSQGGGTSGKGQYPGTQSSAGSGGGFGYGANQTSNNYMHAAGGGGGGWYGGGTSYDDNDVGMVDYNGGGSGFVNTSANASYRPSGYTGL